MHAIFDNTVSQQSLASPSIVIYRPGETDGLLSSITRKTIDKIEQSLGASGGNLVYGGYPYDPFALDALEQWGANSDKPITRRAR